MNPKVSVIIPTYNRADKVGKTIESALVQTFSDLEVIVVDDGSTDNTPELLRQRFGCRIRYMGQPNQGASMARNKGVAEARGEWVAFLDSDDVWEKDKLAWQFKAVKQCGPQCGACYTDVRLFNYDEERTLFEMAEASHRHQDEIGSNPEVLKLLVRPGGAGMVVCLSSLLARTDLVRGSGGFDPKLLYSQDSEFMFRLALMTGFCYVKRPLVWFDRSPAEIRHVGVSADWNKMDFFLKDSQIRLEGLMAMGSRIPASVRQLIRQQLSSVHSGWTNWYLEAGDYRRARDSVNRAVRMNLTRNIVMKWLLTWVSPALARIAVRRHMSRTQPMVTV